MTVPRRRRLWHRVEEKGLTYCWSVAVAALPEEGKTRMEAWFADPDNDVRWIMCENLKKNRLARIDVTWVAEWSVKLSR